MDIVILLAMIFAHIFADFVFQNNFMATYKQKSNWIEHNLISDRLYKHDYIVVLFVHSFSWAFITYLPLLYYECYIYYALLVILQTPIHKASVNYVRFFFPASHWPDRLFRHFRFPGPSDNDK